jgi:hypothetical protein
MVIVKASKESEAGQMPSEKILSDMGRFNEELVKAGVMLAGEGLGLAIVRQIAERHRATIRIDAGAGGAGTRVTVRLPGSTALPGASEVQPGSRSIPWRAAIEPPADRSPTA